MSKAIHKRRHPDAPIQETKESREDVAIKRSRSFWPPKEPYIMLGLLAAIAAVVFRGYLLLEKAYLFKDIGSDSINGFYAHTIHLVDYLRTDGIPKWSFNQGMGQNLFPETGNIFLPIFYLSGRDNLGFAVAYVEVLKILIGGCFFYLYLKMLDLTAHASFVGGVLFGFSGYMVLGGGWHMFSYDAMCGAILLYGMEILFKKNIWWIIPIPVAMLGAYQPFNLYLYGLLIFTYSTARYLEGRHWNLRTYTGFVCRTAAPALLGAALSGVFLLEHIALLLQSPRVGGGASYFQTLASEPLFSVGSPIELSSVVLRLFSSDLQGTGNDFSGWENYLESPLLYCGLITLLAAPQFLFSLDSRTRRTYVAIAAACMSALIFPYLRYLFWGFTGNYYRTFSFFISLLLLYFGVRGLSHIDRTSNVKPVVLAVTLAVVLGLLYVPRYAQYTDVNQHLRVVITLFLIAYAALIALRGTPKFRRAVQSVTVGLVCIEAAFLSDITVNHREVVSAEELAQRVGYNDYTVDAVKQIHSIDSGFYRVNKDYDSGPTMHISLNDAKVQQYYGSSSYSSFNQMYYVKFLEGVGVVHPGNETETRWAIGLTDRPALQVLGSVKYAFTKDATAYPGSLWDPVKNVGDVHIVRNKLFLPLGIGYDTYVLNSDFSNLDIKSRDRILTKAFVIDDTERDRYQEFTRLDPASPGRTPDEFGQDIALLQASAMQMSEHHQNLIRGTIDLKAKKLVFFSIPYDKGWSATVDGRAAGIQLVDFGLMGLVLETGKHAIELKFRPRFLTMGAVVSAASLAGYVLLLVVPGWSRRRSRSGTEP